MVNHPQVFHLIETEMETLANENRLNSLEKVKNHFRIIPEPFEIGTILTPTMKLRRHIARDKYQHLINEMYAETDNLMNA